MGLDVAPRSDENARLFMALFVGSWSIGFVALLVAHLYIRLDAVSWPPAGVPPPPRALTGLSTVLALASSGTYHFALMAIERGRPTRLTTGLVLSTVLALLFLTVQLAAGMQALARGLEWQSGVYAAFFWIIGGYHYAHVVVGFAAGVWLSTRAYARTFTADRHLPVTLWGYYWHSIGLMWVLIYLFVFVL